MVSCRAAQSSDAGALGAQTFASLFSKYFNEYVEYSYDEFDKKLDWAGFQTSVGRYPIYDDIKYRKDVQTLEALLTERWGWFVSRHQAAGEWWKKIDAPVRYYLLCRAADQISFGERYQSLPGSTCAPYEEVVSALVSLSKETKRGIEEAEEKEAAIRERQRIEKECAEKVGKISYSPPELLEPRVLGAAERQAVREACMREIMEGPQVVKEVAGTIDAFARFCVLLAKPENHIKVRTGQYVERQVRERSEIDMVNESARLLSSIAPYTAYVRLEKRQSGAGAWTGKVRTEALAGVASGALAYANSNIEDNVHHYTRTREEIREEIRKRQEPWRVRVRVEAPAAKERKEPISSRRGESAPEEPMPPTSITEELKGGEADTRERGDGASRTPRKGTGFGGGVESLPQTTRSRLIYRSDFTQPTGWDEGHSDKVKVFRLDGYYHIALYNGPYSAWFTPALPLDDFKAEVDVELNIQSGKTADCGMVFCVEDGKRDGTFFFYAFTVSRNGFYRLHSASETESRIIIDWQSAEMIRNGDATNSLMVEKVRCGRHPTYKRWS